MSADDAIRAERDRAAVAAHARWRGKITIMPKCPIRGHEDWAVWYTPGVAAAARAIAAAPERSCELTGRGDTIAIVSDGSRVLGLGDVGPEAAMPVMEGKALLFKYLGAVDAVPICIGRHETQEIVGLIEALAPSYGGINLEDIAAPKCFRVLERLQASLPIPVWHDDQQGTAAAVLAGLWNALRLVGKQIGSVRIALIGLGAANHATYRLLSAAGADPGRIVACDSQGILHPGRQDIAEAAAHLREKWDVCQRTNAEWRIGGIPEALEGADVCLAFSAPGPDTIPSAAVARMAPGAIVFACANPVPEIWPEDALQAGAAVVATGRSDFPNQVNNALVFPGLFRGVLDVGAQRITDGLALAAARALAATVQHPRTDAILPRIDSVDAAAAVAEAVARAAVASGGAARPDRAEGTAARIRARIADIRSDAAYLAGLGGEYS